MRELKAALLFMLIFSIGFGVSQAQAIKFNFIVISAVCGSGNTINIDVDADTYVPGVLLQVHENGTLTVNQTRNHSGVLGWDGGSRALDGTQTYTKTVTVYNGTTVNSGVADQSSYTLNCTDRVNGENALITICNLGETCSIYNEKIAPVITSAASANGAVGRAFSHTFTAEGDPAPTFSYSAENLPPGVTRTGDTLSGMPTAAGNYSITATASNGASPDAVQVFEITVTGTAPTITSAASANGVVGTAFSHTFTAAGDPAPTFSYSAENLPPGVTRTGDTLSGTPTAPGNYSITATASNGVSPDAVQVFEITITGDAPVITSAAQGYAEQGAAFSHTFTAIGNPAPTLTYSDVNLPPSITLTGGTLSGIPTVDGQFSVTVTASNGVAPDAVQVFILTVGGLPVPPPTPLCEDHNFSEDGVVRSSTADAFGHALNCRVLYQNGAPTSWMGGSLYTGGSIGVEGIFDLGVQTAIDIFSPSGVSYFEGGAVFCLKGSGWLIWLAADGAPRVPEIIGSYIVPEWEGFTCATLFEPGTLVLVSQNPVR